MNNNIITKYEEEKSEIQLLKELAHSAVKSGNYPLTESQIFNIMLSAKDLGVSPMKAINGGFNIIEGKISMSAALMTDRIRKDGHSIKIIEWTREKCVIIGQRKDNGDSIRAEFNIEDAKCAEVLNKNQWRKYPKAMYYCRAMTMLARSLFPDIVGNCYSEEEAEEIKNNRFEDNLKKSKHKQEDSICTSASKNIDDAIIEISVEEAKNKLIESFEIPHHERLTNYLDYCFSSIDAPISKCVEKWIQNQERFLTCYKKWIDKNPTENT